MKILVLICSEVIETTEDKVEYYYYGSIEEVNREGYKEQTLGGRM